MFYKQDRFKILLLSSILLIISFVFIVIFGRVYTLAIPVEKEVTSIDDLSIEMNGNEGIVKVIDKKLEDGKFIFKVKAIKKGNTFFEIRTKHNYTYLKYYVHAFGIVTIDNFFGDTRGDEVIPISIFIILLYAISILIKKYKSLVEENLYQYKNILYLGLIIFLSFSALDQFFHIFYYRGLFNTIEKAIYMTSELSTIAFPFVLFVSIFVIISNIVLMVREGIKPKNMLGIFMTICLVFAMVLPDITGEYLYSHSGLECALYVDMLIDSFVYGAVAYLECILIATIVISIKAAKRIPKYNQDYMMILGCRIKNDGTLTRLLQSRVDRAIEFSKKQKEETGKDIIFIPSGGKGNDEVTSEADAIKNYLIEQGISKKQILVENKSTNTLENIKYSNELVKSKKEGNLSFSTTNYHVFRAGVIASNLNIKVEGIGAHTRSYFWINAFIREFIATLYSERKKHHMIIRNIFLFSIILVGIIYLANIL